MVYYGQRKTYKEVKRPKHVRLRTDEANTFRNHPLQGNWNGLLHVEHVNVAHKMCTSMNDNNCHTMMCLFCDYVHRNEIQDIQKFVNSENGTNFLL